MTAAVLKSIAVDATNGKTRQALPELGTKRHRKAGCRMGDGIRSGINGTCQAANMRLVEDFPGHDSADAVDRVHKRLKIRLHPFANCPLVAHEQLERLQCGI